MGLDAMQIALVVTAFALVITIVLAILSLAVIKKVNSPDHDGDSDSVEGGTKVIRRFATRLSTNDLRDGHNSPSPHSLGGSAPELNGPLGRKATQEPKLLNSSSLAGLVSLCMRKETQTAKAESSSSTRGATSGIVVCIHGSDEDKSSSTTPRDSPEDQHRKLQVE